MLRRGSSIASKKMLAKDVDYLLMHVLFERVE